MSGTRAVIVNITASEDSLGMDETTQIVEHVQNTAGNEANIIYGIVYDDNMGDSLRVTVIATRFAEVGRVSQFEPQFEQQQQATNRQVLETEPVSPPRRTLNRRLDRKERNARVNNLNSKTYDIHDPESLQGLETVPAYQRKRVTLNLDNSDPMNMSRHSVDEGPDQKYQLKDNNSFLHDNVD